MAMQLIPQEMYEKIVEHTPIACVDIVVRSNGKFLLGKRTNDPARGRWYPIGGRIHKGESMVDAAARKLKEELGISAPPSAFRLVTVEDTIFVGYTTDQNRHSINIVYLIDVGSAPQVHPDSQNEEVAWFEHIDPAWDPYVINILTKAQI